MGEDQIRAFTSWHEWSEIARISVLCVAQRGQPAAQPQVPGATIITLQLPDMPVSATEIRERVQRGEEIASLVPAAVAGYIAANHLYQGH
jgi:nicotinate-nucleotide adenylyltransferase